MGEHTERRRAHGPRLALSMADFEANFGAFERALYWSAIAEVQLGRLPAHYRNRRDTWRFGERATRSSDR